MRDWQALTTCGLGVRCCDGFDSPARGWLRADTYIKVFGVDFVVLGQVEVLFGYEYALCD